MQPKSNDAAPSREVKITYLDTAMVLIEVGSIRLLTDPVLDASGSRFDHGPVHLHKISPSAIAPERLGRIDAVLLSHDQHADNLDGAGRKFLTQAPLTITTVEGAARLNDVHAIGLEPWSSTQVTGPEGDELTVTAMPAQHGPDGTQEATGPVIGFLLNGPDIPSIYLSGDTVPFEGTEEIARRFAPVGIALLNLGHVQLAPMGDLHFSMSAGEALAFAESLQCSWLVPLHFEGWRHFTEGRQAVARVLGLSKLAAKVRLLESGVATYF